MSRELGGRIKPNKREVDELVSKLGGYQKVIGILNGKLEVKVFDPKERPKQQSTTEM